MSTDPKKFVKSIVLTFVIACFMMIIGVNMSFHYLPVIVFTFISVALFLSAALSTNAQYKKYPIKMYRFLSIVGLIMAVLMIILCIMILI